MSFLLNIRTGGGSVSNCQKGQFHAARVTHVHLLLAVLTRRSATDTFALHLACGHRAKELRKAIPGTGARSVRRLLSARADLGGSNGFAEVARATRTFALATGLPGFTFVHTQAVRAYSRANAVGEVDA